MKLNINQALLNSFIILNLVDLFTFNWVISRIGLQFISVELGPIGIAYSNFGLAGAMIYKLLLIMIIVSCAFAAEKYRTFIMIVGVIAVTFAALSNIYAAYQLGMISL